MGGIYSGRYREDPNNPMAKRRCVFLLHHTHSGEPNKDGSNIMIETREIRHKIVRMSASGSIFIDVYTQYARDKRNRMQM